MRLPVDAALEHFDEITSAPATRQPVHRTGRRRRSSRSGARRGHARLRGARRPLRRPGRDRRPRHPSPGIDPRELHRQLGGPARGTTACRTSGMDFTPSNGDELQSEFLVPRAHAVAALAAVRALSDRVAPLLQVTEVRTMAGDDLWLSRRRARTGRPALHVAARASPRSRRCCRHRGRAGPVRREAALGQALPPAPPPMRCTRGSTTSGHSWPSSTRGGRSATTTSTGCSARAEHPAGWISSRPRRHPGPGSRRSPGC